MFPYVIETLVKTRNSVEALSLQTYSKNGCHLIILLYASKLALLASFMCLQFKRIFGSYGLVFPLQFLVLPNLHSCFYITVWKHEKCFLFLKQRHEWKFVRTRNCSGTRVLYYTILFMMAYTMAYNGVNLLPMFTILKIIFGIYTRCQQIDLLKKGKFECQKDIHLKMYVFLTLEFTLL